MNSFIISFSSDLYGSDNSQILAGLILVVREKVAFIEFLAMMMLFVVVTLLLLVVTATSENKFRGSSKENKELPKGVFRPSAFGKLYPVLTDGPPPGYDEVYGYPDTIGGLIIEGPFAYQNGPDVYSPDNPLGAYGLIDAAGAVGDDGQCPPIPEDSPFAGSNDVKPVQFKEMKTCGLGCSPDDIAAGKPDPCAAGSLSDPSLSNSPMSCFKIGNMLRQGYTGMCGYNCTALMATSTDVLQGCTDFSDPNCLIYCDSRTFPTATGRV